MRWPTKLLSQFFLRLRFQRVVDDRERVFQRCCALLQSYLKDVEHYSNPFSPHHRRPSSAIESLRQLGDARALPLLLDLGSARIFSRCSVESEQRAALSAFFEIGGTVADENFMRLLHSPYENQRRLAKSLVLKFGTPDQRAGIVPEVIEDLNRSIESLIGNYSYDSIGWKTHDRNTDDYVRRHDSLKRKGYPPKSGFSPPAFEIPRELASELEETVGLLKWCPAARSVLEKCAGLSKLMR